MSFPELKKVLDEYAKKFNSNNADAYIPHSEWKKLTEEQKAEARKAREAKGIPVRAVGSISQVPATGNNSQGETGASNSGDTRAIHLLRAPPVRHFSTTKRSSKVNQIFVRNAGCGQGSFL